MPTKLNQATLIKCSLIILLVQVVTSQLNVNPSLGKKKNSLIEKLTKMPQSVVGIFLLIMLKSVIVQSQPQWDKVKLINFAATKSHKLPFDLRQLTFNWW